jgi:hypothetical protein
MSETTLTNINNNDRKSERIINMRNQDNEGFPMFIIVILLAVIWMVTNFTVFICMVVIVLISKIVTTSNANVARNNNEINISLSPQVYMKCSSTMTDDAMPEPLTNICHSPINNAGGQFKSIPFRELFV